MCKKIHRGGNAEQYHADKKYKEAVAVAVEACAEDTKGQTCYIWFVRAKPSKKRCARCAKRRRCCARRTRGAARSKGVTSRREAREEELRGGRALQGRGATLDDRARGNGTTLE